MTFARFSVLSQNFAKFVKRSSRNRALRLLRSIFSSGRIGILFISYVKTSLMNSTSWHTAISSTNFPLRSFWDNLCIGENKEQKSPVRENFPEVRISSFSIKRLIISWTKPQKNYFYEKFSMILIMKFIFLFIHNIFRWG